ncbi:hypothetical protein ACIBEA_30420 [Streptomyces sp. NPDC051555]|uniref:hypothetical protein n=1 Tax=Streptomyces sp. NPDC051555 TaxID=3365657 RepID=UPI0037B9D13C
MPLWYISAATVRTTGDGPAHGRQYWVLGAESDTQAIRRVLATALSQSSHDNRRGAEINLDTILAEPWYPL